MQQLGLLLLMLRAGKHGDVVLRRLTLLRLCVKLAFSCAQWDQSTKPLVVLCAGMCTLQ